MNAGKIAAIVLIFAGVLGLAYGSFSYTKQTHDIKMGPIEMSVKEKQTVNVLGLGRHRRDRDRRRAPAARRPQALVEFSTMTRPSGFTDIR